MNKRGLVILCLASGVVGGLIVYGAVAFHDQHQYEITEQQTITRTGSIMSVDPAARTLEIRSQSVVYGTAETIIDFKVADDAYIATQSVLYNDANHMSGFGPLKQIPLSDVTSGSFLSVVYDKNAGGPLIARSIIVQFLAPTPGATAPVPPDVLPATTSTPSLL